MNDWDVFVLKDKKILITNFGGFPADAVECLGVNLEYYEALRIARKKSEELGYPIEEDDINYCPVCGCYAGFHPDGTECDCPCCCYDPEDLEECPYGCTFDEGCIYHGWVGEQCEFCDGEPPVG